ncbi:unnamed protein product [Vicia faba]|uniref:Uncharacterized protein n=1 Tax=Vicia faba TaxID=3906 RepID=A0AAV1AM96_VICFA|nr:unnamed protein product [Vicia faba]
MRLSIERNRDFGRIEICPNPSSESIIEAKFLENLHQKQPVNNIKCLFNLHFHNQFTTISFLVYQIISFRSKPYTIFNASPLNKTFLLSGNDNRHNGRKSICNNLRSDFKFKVS